MKHSLLRLSQSIFNVPHLITPQAFNVVLDYLDARNSGKQLMVPMDTISEPEEDNDPTDGLFVLSIDGSLTYKPLMTMCGEVGTSYQSLTDQVEEAIENGATTIVMNVTSGGGEASHLFETSSAIRQMCTDANVKLLAYADTMACSAAYGLSVIADVLVVNPSAIVGSIGCVVCLLDDSVAMDNAGLKRVFITSGDSKVPYDSDGKFKSDFLESVQEDVDALNDQFASFVSQYTGIDTETIKGFQAQTYNAQEAVELGLATSVMTNKEFAAYAVSVHQGAPYDQ